METGQEEAGQHVMDLLLPILNAEGGPVPGMPGWHLNLFFLPGGCGTPMPGAAFFQIAGEPNTSKRPVVMAVACWSDTMQAEAWQKALASYQALRPALLPLNLWREPATHAPLVP